MMSEDQLKYLRILSEEGDKKYRLTGMFKDWFLEYSSYVILERAVPHITDGLKPVQRRILHSMKRMEDGRYNKVANIIGHTMQFHPHGDASIGDALVQLGQKELLIDTQGNWGNIYTGDSAAAPRYIEARLSKFALDVVFNPKTTLWIPSYDGRNQEPEALPVKFPLLLAQGAEGIAVGLATRILPHNFNELLDASISHLKGEQFVLYPDFITGGLIDCSNYNGGIGSKVSRVKVRARIIKADKKTLAITEIPYGQTTESLIRSIIAANDKGKIKIRKIDDNTAEQVEILIHLASDVSPDKTIDALYAFTKCEVTISPDACVIMDGKPFVMSVEDMLSYSTDRTRLLLKAELDIRMAELEDDWHLSSLEKIFFEEKIYRILENNARTWEDQLHDVESEMLRFQDRLRRPVTFREIEKLVEKPVRKISRFDIKKADEHIKLLDKEMERIGYNLEHLTAYAIEYFESLKKKYGSRFPRRTEITGFETIEASKVILANCKLYVNKESGFVGTDIKKDDQAEYVCDCSNLDDVIVFLRDGSYSVRKVADKLYVGKDIIYTGIFRKKDNRTVYNVAYRDGKNGKVYVKRFIVNSVTRDKEYNLTQGKPGSQILWFSANPNGEAETIRMYLKARPKLKKLIYEYSFLELAIKGRNSRGNILSRYPVQKITLKDKGIATLGGQKIWFDQDIQRLNDDERGIYLGEFLSDESLLAINRNGTFYTTNFDLSNRYQEEVLVIEKFDPEKIYSAVYFDGNAGFFYLKRFRFERSENLVQSFIGDAEESYLTGLSQDKSPVIEVTFGGKHAKRPPMVIDVVEFIGDKSFRAKGKRITTLEVMKIEFKAPEPLPGEATGPEEDENMDFELEGPVFSDQTPGTKETDKKQSMDFNDEDAIQMTLL
ncbi:MAG: DNA gyrase/topoisomerase IV subunit A [Bacteroidales bacterium]|jgi:topoisomerase-4 subunit A|nr:DNA gyrase/topoisomerase IV subunit A [Bacteroidales bacterium]MDD2831386.1 DNA gyrase/topoisomerase IV subunit A [Bacteroidales bacterium]MDD4473119.1 DNA gyrase/topoisomerase IV subunit A [Bacteroidales bacterium]MDD5516549.1 DNA gyrase/topoisomerase IV subunit A [Bacteroidales bacterium]HHV02380.1 DNA gyrase/topoisomerase IV subunit A [Bacteroidales bacterium]